MSVIEQLADLDSETLDDRLARVPDLRRQANALAGSDAAQVVALSLVERDEGRELARRLMSSDEGRARALELAESNAGVALANHLASSNEGLALARRLAGSAEGLAFATHVARSREIVAVALNLVKSTEVVALGHDLAQSTAGQQLASVLAENDDGVALAHQIARSTGGEALAIRLAGSDAGIALARSLALSDAAVTLASSLIASPAGHELLVDLAHRKGGEALTRSLAHRGGGLALARALSEGSACWELAPQLAVGSDTGQALALQLADSDAGRALALQLADSDAGRALVPYLTATVAGGVAESRRLALAERDDEHNRSRASKQLAESDVGQSMAAFVFAASICLGGVAAAPPLVLACIGISYMVAATGALLDLDNNQIGQSDELPAPEGGTVGREHRDSSTLNKQDYSAGALAIEPVDPLLGIDAVAFQREVEVLLDVARQVLEHEDIDDPVKANRMRINIEWLHDRVIYADLHIGIGMAAVAPIAFELAALINEFAPPPTTDDQPVKDLADKLIAAVAAHSHRSTELVDAIAEIVEEKNGGRVSKVQVKRALAVAGGASTVTALAYDIGLEGMTTASAVFVVVALGLIGLVRLMWYEGGD